MFKADSSGRLLDPGVAYFADPYSDRRPHEEGVAPTGSVEATIRTRHEIVYSRGS